MDIIVIFGVRRFFCQKFAAVYWKTNWLFLDELLDLAIYSFIQLYVVIYLFVDTYRIDKLRFLSVHVTALLIGVCYFQHSLNGKTPLHFVVEKKSADFLSWFLDVVRYFAERRVAASSLANPRASNLTILIYYLCQSERSEHLISLAVVVGVVVVVSK